MFKRKMPETPIPELGFGETQELIKLLGGPDSPVTFARFDGAVVGLGSTLNAPLSELWTLLDWEPPARIRELGDLYASDMKNGLSEGLMSPQMETFKTPEQFFEWLSGLGDALMLRPDKLMPIIGQNIQELTDAALTPALFATRQSKEHGGMLQIPDQEKVLWGLKAEFAQKTPDDFLKMQMDYTEALLEIYSHPDLERAAQRFTGSRPTGTIRREGKKILPNAPCPCGSGKKYKKCCGALPSA